MEVGLGPEFGEDAVVLGVVVGAGVGVSFVVVTGAGVELDIVGTDGVGVAGNLLHPASITTAKRRINTRNVVFELLIGFVQISRHP